MVAAGAGLMLILDAQVHVYERNHPGRPWFGVLKGPAEVTGDDMVAAMDAAGVDGAIIVSPFTHYRYDASYALSVQAAHPERFRVVKPFDVADPAVEETVADWSRTEGAVAVRLLLAEADPDDPGIDRLLAAAARHSLPVNVMGWGRLAQIDSLATKRPDTLFVIDHFGLPQRFERPPPKDPFADLGRLLALARHDNVAVKLTAAGALSHQPFPFDDLWEPLARIFDAFGLSRCMWGSDWTRAMEFFTYPQAVDAFRLSERLSETDKATLMSGSLQRIYGWRPAARAAQHATSR
jgi:predicted TIM-barrel fold metal-dependent hydrolase